MKGLLLAGGHGTRLRPPPSLAFGDREVARFIYGHADDVRSGLGMRSPNRLEEIHARLYRAFGIGPFDLELARSALGLDGRRAKLALSGLERAGRLVVFEGTLGDRRYRLLDPPLVAFALENGLSLARFMSAQGAYVRLLLLFAKKILERYGDGALSIVLYGSVARGDSSRESDLDLLLIVNGLPRSYSKRVEELVSLEMD
ncbi:MAG: nucleotidyltransferase domain-containing protein, partial [Candidatus Bathyarchaeia archaeon]